MTDGYGYQDGDWFVFDGFSIALVGETGRVELIPESLFTPQLGDDAANCLFLRIRVSVGQYRGETELSTHLGILWRFQEAIEHWSCNGEQGFCFPKWISGEETASLTVERSAGLRGWVVNCRLTSQEINKGADLSRCPAVALECEFMLDGESVEITRRDLTHFRRHVASLRT